MQSQLQVRKYGFLINYNGKIEKILSLFRRGRYLGKIKENEDFFFKEQILSDITLKKNLFMF